METTIKKLVELAKEVTDYFKPVQSNNTWQDYTPNIRVYFANSHNTKAVQFGHNSISQQISVSLYNGCIDFGFDHTAEYLEKVYNETLNDFENYKVSRSGKRESEIQEAKERQIKELQDRLSELTQ